MILQPNDHYHHQMAMERVQGANLELNFQVIEESDTDLRSDYYLPSEGNKVCK